MRFWDASALVPALIDEVTSRHVREALALDGGIMAWWGTAVECMSAIARGEREGRLRRDEVVRATRTLDMIRDEWIEIEATPQLREIGLRLLRVHPLRAVDALQLAAAISAAEAAPSSLPFVTLDDRLATAADREGFTVIRFDLDEA